MKLRLFAIKALADKRLIPDLYFPNKQEAKKKRNELGAATHCVTFGPDHREFRHKHDTRRDFAR